MTPRLGLCLLTCVAAGCGATAPSAASSRSQTTPPVAPTSAAAPTSATELVTLLRDIASGARPGSVEDHVDRAFAERLASANTLEALFQDWPEGCVPTLREGPGYGAVAIPPPMEDDSPEEVARIEGIIDVLRGSTEVEASCTVVETYQEEVDEPATPHERTLMLFAIATRADAHGVFHALAWRDFRQDMPGNQ